MMEIAKLIESEIGDFFAGFGHPGEPETPEEMQSQLLARVMPLLAGMEQEPVAWRWNYGGSTDWRLQEITPSKGDNKRCPRVIQPLYAAPQLPQPAVVDEWRMMCGEWRDETVSIHDDSGLIVSGISPNAAGIIIEAHNACRAAMLQGAEPVATVYKLPFEQWLSQQTGTIDVECGCVMTEVFYHWLRVAYEAGNSPLIHDGWVAVPVEPTEEMIEATFAGEMELQSVQHQVRNRERRAHYYRAMLAAAPQQEVK